MSAFETDATIETGGELTLTELPFAVGQTVRVRIEEKAALPAAEGRVLGLHQGTVWISEDFDEPLPEAFWLGNASGNEAPA